MPLKLYFTAVSSAQSDVKGNTTSATGNPKANADDDVTTTIPLVETTIYIPANLTFDDLGFFAPCVAKWIKWWSAFPGYIRWDAACVCWGLKCAPGVVPPRNISTEAIQGQFRKSHRELILSDSKHTQIYMSRRYVTPIYLLLFLVGLPGK